MDQQDFVTAYELIYVLAAGKDYEQESREITALIRQRRPDADSLLDVACGSGLHLAHLRDSFSHVEGLEPADPMREAAKARLAGVPVHAHDMRDFRLGRTFDAVTCLFSSIGYLRSVAELEQTLRCLAAHLAPGGVLLLEPWFTPSQWTPGVVHRGMAGDGRRHVTRMSYSDQHGVTSTMSMHYLLGETGGGIRHWIEEHAMTLFTDQEYERAIRRAGFGDFERLPGWHDQRPRLVATLTG